MGVPFAGRRPPLVPPVVVWRQTVPLGRPAEPLWPRWRTSSFVLILSIDIITIFIVMRLRTSSSFIFSLSSLLGTRSQPSSFFHIHLIMSLHHHQILFIQLILPHLPHLIKKKTDLATSEQEKKTNLDIFDQEKNWSWHIWSGGGGASENAHKQLGEWAQSKRWEYFRSKGQAAEMECYVEEAH